MVAVIGIELSTSTSVVGFVCLFVRTDKAYFKTDFLM
jgi:hypothetical protein